MKQILDILLHREPHVSFQIYLLDRGQSVLNHSE